MTNVAIRMQIGKVGGGRFIFVFTSSQIHLFIHSIE